MAAKTASLFIILTFQFLIITSKADEALITRLCNGTPSPDACKSCLHSEPASSSADEVGLAVLTISCATTDISELYKTTIGEQQSATNPALKEALGSCLSQITGAQSKAVPVATDVKGKQFDLAQGLIKFQIVAPIFDCTKNIQSKGLQVPDNVSKGVSNVARDWNVVLSILDSIK